ncbi:diguanylate cyclase domain-containing protein [Thalassomonas actiniarum]|uniref:diguanylate cyclase n=1 Tax=Thalassomonas actiniarum TaxID=485447 RepID=A0AAF0C3S0_9GAMM|nr:diguanylate cyclase [Thalassomonas actiniarum]WDD98994.1 diguanylate cyclase [Thalassomonas actiniarum]
MKHHDSIKQANQKMNRAIAQLQQWQLPATPVNYAVGYDYVDGKNAPLIAAIKRRLSRHKRLDAFFIEESYRQYILGQSKFREEIVTDLDNIAADLGQNCQRSCASTSRFIGELESGVEAITSADQAKSARALQQLLKSATALKQQQRQLLKKLKKSQQQTAVLLDELEEVRQEVYLDPLTGLFNTKAMAQHLELWFKEIPDRKIAAIAINIDHFFQYSDNFGPLISDVILSKIATKISSYVDKSGLPVRSGGDEFVILLPDINSTAAKEIAEKIRQGIEKLRFISSQTGTRLPKTTISLGISEMTAPEPVQQVLMRSRKAVTRAQKDGRNRVATAQEN